MSKSYLLGDLISDYYENDFLNVEETPLPVFSSNHKRKMKKAFKIFKNNNAKCHRPLSFKRRLLIAAVIIVCLAFMTGGVIAFFSNGFRGRVYTDNTYLFAVNTSGCPTTIEEEYRLSVVPNGYELSKTMSNSANVYNIYKSNSGDDLVFQQTVKSEFNPHINTEYDDLEEITINGHNAVCIEFKINEKRTKTSSLVVWDNGKYVVTLHGEFSKDELVQLAEENDIKGFELVWNGGKV